MLLQSDEIPLLDCEKSKRGTSIETLAFCQEMGSSPGGGCSKTKAIIKTRTHA